MILIDKNNLQSFSRILWFSLFGKTHDESHYQSHALLTVLEFISLTSG